MRVSVRVDPGVFEQRMRRREAVAIAASQQAVAQAANTVLTRTQFVMPVKTGALRASGECAVDMENLKIVGSVGFGNTSLNPNTGRTTASYAVEKHEDPRNGKFLENTLQDYAEEFLDTLAEALQKAF